MKLKSLTLCRQLHQASVGGAEMLKKGDRVKLTDKMAQLEIRGYRHCPMNRIEGRYHVDWANRRGTVMNTPYPSSACVNVKWDDRKTGEAYPKGMIELVEPEHAEP